MNGVPEDHDIRDLRISRIVVALEGVAPARRRPRRSAGRKVAVRGVMSLALLVGCANIAAATSHDMPRIPYLTWVSPSGNVWKDTSGDGVPDEVYATVATPSPLGCSLLGMSGPDAAAYLARQNQPAIWELGIGRGSQAIDVRTLVEPPPEDSVVADEVFRAGEAMRITLVVGDVSVFRSLAPTSTACR